MDHFVEADPNVWSFCFVCLFPSKSCKLRIVSQSSDEQKSDFLLEIHFRLCSKKIHNILWYILKIHLLQ